MSRASRILILLLVVAVAFSLGYAALESAHDCHGAEDCPICKIIALVPAFLGVCLLPLLVWVTLLLVQKRQEGVRSSLCSVTPVRLKVKMLI